MLINFHVITKLLNICRDHTLASTVTMDFSAWQLHYGYHTSRHFAHRFFPDFIIIFYFWDRWWQLNFMKHVAIYSVIGFTKFWYVNINCSYWDKSVARMWSGDFKTFKKFLSGLFLLCIPYQTNAKKFGLKRGIIRQLKIKKKVWGGNSKIKILLNYLWRFYSKMK